MARARVGDGEEGGLGAGSQVDTGAGSVPVSAPGADAAQAAAPAAQPAGRGRLRLTVTTTGGGDGTDPAPTPSHTAGPHRNAPHERIANVGHCFEELVRAFDLLYRNRAAEHSQNAFLTSEQYRTASHSIELAVRMHGDKPLSKQSTETVIATNQRFIELIAQDEDLSAAYKQFVTLHGAGASPRTYDELSKLTSHVFAACQQVIARNAANGKPSSHHFTEAENALNARFDAAVEKLHSTYSALVKNLSNPEAKSAEPLSAHGASQPLSARLRQQRGGGFIGIASQQRRLTPLNPEEQGSGRLSVTGNKLERPTPKTGRPPQSHQQPRSPF